MGIDLCVIKGGCVSHVKTGSAKRMADGPYGLIAVVQYFITDPYGSYVLQADLGDRQYVSHGKQAVKAVQAQICKLLQAEFGGCKYPGLCGQVPPQASDRIAFFPYPISYVGTADAVIGFCGRGRSLSEDHHRG